MQTRFLKKRKKKKKEVALENTFSDKNFFETFYITYFHIHLSGFIQKLEYIS